MAISLLKLGQNNNAYWQLKNVLSGDDGIESVVEGVPEDEEMKQLVDKVADSYTQRMLRAELDRLASLPKAHP